MPSLSGRNKFSSSSRNLMGSNVQTVQNQGGGEKKAGFPYQVGRESWTSIFLRTTAPVSGQCCTLKQIMTMKFPAANPSKPIGADVRISRYHMSF
jgi:hypothetical protein